MNWIAISGSWRKTNLQVKRDVEKKVKEIVRRGDGIITGGALGVDFIATVIYFELDPKLSKIKIFLPTTLDLYLRHMYRRAREKVITVNQAKMLVDLLKRIKSINPTAVIENNINQVCNQTTYYQRIDKMINEANELIAFQINNSVGTQYTIDKAKEKGIPVETLTYQII